MSFGDITNVTTGEARLSYVHLFKPYAHNQGDKERFSCTILVPKSDTATKARIDAAIEAAKQKGVAYCGNSCPYGHSYHNAKRNYFSTTTISSAYTES